MAIKEAFQMKQIKRSAIKMAEYNPRIINDSERKNLKKGMNKLGMLQPLVWNEKTETLVSGHQRLSILDSEKKGEDYFLSVAVVNLDDKQEKEANILLNNPSAQGDWDLDKLGEMVKSGIDPMAAGFDTADVYKLFGENPNFSMDETAAAALTEMATLMDKLNEGVAKASKKNLTDDFYLVFVFDSYEARKKWTDNKGLEDNKFQDARVLCEVAEE